MTLSLSVVSKTPERLLLIFKLFSKPKHAFIWLTISMFVIEKTFDEKSIGIRGSHGDSKYQLYAAWGQTLLLEQRKWNPSRSNKLIEEFFFLGTRKVPAIVNLKNQKMLQKTFIEALYQNVNYARWPTFNRAFLRHVVVKKQDMRSQFHLLVSIPSCSAVPGPSPASTIASL